MSEQLLTVLVVSVAAMGCVVVLAALVMVVTLAFVVWRYLQQFSYPAELALRRDVGPDYAEHAQADADAAGRGKSDTPPTGKGDDDVPGQSGGPTGGPMSGFGNDDGYPTPS